MKTTIEDWVETFIKASDERIRHHTGASEVEFTSAGLLAVIEKHVGPILVDACVTAASRFATQPQPGPLLTEVKQWCEAHAEIFIAQLKGQP